QAALFGAGIEFMPEPPGRRSTRWLTVVAADPDIVGVDREEIRISLLKHGIECRPLWKPMHLQPLYAGAPYHGVGLDQRLFETGLCLPSGSDMTEEQQDEVIDRMLCILSK